MMKYRKKPVEIYAVQWNGNLRDIPNDFLNLSSGTTHMMINDGRLKIKTLEGTMNADVGDWIICGVKGELYPCKPNIFEETYEKVQ